MDRNDLINAILGCPAPPIPGNTSALVEEYQERGQHGGGPPSYRWRIDGLCRTRKSELKRLYDGVKVEHPVLHNGVVTEAASPVKPVALPSLDLNGLSTARLVKLGIIAPSTAMVCQCPLGLIPIDFYSGKGLIQTWDPTPLAIEQWVPLDVTLGDIMHASGCRCDPARIAHAIEVRKRVKATYGLRAGELPPVDAGT